MEKITGDCLIAYNSGRKQAMDGLLSSLWNVATGKV